MDRSLLWGVVVVVLVLAVIGGIYLFTAAPSNQYISQTQNTTGNQIKAKGTLVLAVTDAAVNMQKISAITMTVDKVAVHGQGSGWVTLSTTPTTFNLLELKATSALQVAAQGSVPAGNYDQVWLHVSKITVTESGVISEAKIPSGDFKMQGMMQVTADATSSATLDVLADQSLHKTGKGEFIFTPVVNFESRSNVTVEVNDTIATINNGTITATGNAGMDVSGQVKADFKVESGTTLEINNGIINIKAGAGTSTSGGTNSSSGTGVNAGTNVNINSDINY